MVELAHRRRAVGAGLLLLLAGACGLWWLASRDRIVDLPANQSVPQSATEPLSVPRALDSQRALIEPIPEAPREPAPAPEYDATETDIAAFIRECPPRTIEGIVLRGTKPVSGGRAWLGSEENGGLPFGSWKLWDAAGHVERTEIGADGVFRFVDLEPGNYTIGVRTPEGLTRHVVAELRPEQDSGARIPIVFGFSGIRGQVFDEQGSLLAGWEVGIASMGGLAQVQVLGASRTDARGAYEFPDLVGGCGYMIQVSPTSDFRDPNAKTRFVDLLAHGFWEQVDFGSPRGVVTWTGRLLRPRGSALELAGLARIDAESQGTTERVPLDRGGRIRAQLAPGTYSLTLIPFTGRRGLGGTRVPLGKVTLALEPLEQDLRVPPALVHVRAKPADSPSSFSLVGEDSVRSVWAADGSQYFLGVPPGEYRLLCSSGQRIRGATGSWIPVTVGASDDEIELDVVLDP